MFGLKFLAAALLAFSSVVVADPIVEERGAVTQTLAYFQPTQSCVAGAEIIVARASDEAQGEGVLGGLANEIEKLIPNSNSVAVVYPATLDNYPTSEQEGVVGMKILVTNYVQQCPGHFIILLGYSQGAQVVADTLIGSDEKGFSDDSTNPTGLGTEYLKQIAAIIMMGDPGHTVGAPGSVGNATKDGIFPRENNDAFNQYGLTSRLQTYCDANDEFCASGNSLAVHVGYVAEYGSQAASFAAAQFTSANGGPVVGGSSGSATSAGQASSQAMTSAASSAAQTSAAASSSAGMTAASSAKATSAATSAAAKTSAAGSSSMQTGNPNPASIQALLTSNRYIPTTTFATARFTELGALQPAAAAPGVTANRGIAGAVFGLAMFAMGMI